MSPDVAPVTSAHFPYVCERLRLRHCQSWMDRNAFNVKRNAMPAKMICLVVITESAEIRNIQRKNYDEGNYDSAGCADAKDACQQRSREANCCTVVCVMCELFHQNHTRM